MPNYRPFFALLIALPCCLAATNVTLVPPDDSLVFSSGWEADSGRQFFFLDDLGTALSATLPGSASHVYYVGFKLPQGSAYGFCVDCNAQGDLSSTQVVDGQDSSLSDPDTRTPVVLFSAPLESSSNHDLTVLNLPDDRFGGVSRIIFISLLVTVEGDLETTTEQPTLMPSSLATSASETTSINSLSSASASSPSSLSLSIVSSSQSATVSSTNPQASAGGANASTASVSSSLIAVIVVLSALAVLSLLLGLFVFFRKRNRRIRAMRRQSELSFKDRPMSEFSGKPASTDSGVGPLAAAGRIPPARRDLNSLVQNQWRPMPPVPGSTGSPIGLSPNRWVSSRDEV